MEQVLRADRGQALQCGSSDADTGNRCFAISRLGSAQLSEAQFTFWVQVRGSSWIEAREGRFRLKPGDWIALEKDSRPMVQAGRSGLCVGLGLNADALQTIDRFADRGLYAGRGRIGVGELRTVLRLWRAAAANLDGSAGAHALRPILLQLATMQHELGTLAERCPGRSRSRKRQVFARLQRARLYLDGHRDRVVRIGELAELTSFSSWYFSKTFQALYRENPQAVAARLRLEHAAELLRSSSMTIGEVAASSGFDNCCSFARAFRARFGMPASRYRRLPAIGEPASHRPLRADSAKRTGVDRKAA